MALLHSERCLEFLGTGNPMVVVPLTASLTFQGDDAFSVVFWFKTNDNELVGFVTHQTVTTDHGWSVFIRDTGEVEFGWEASSPNSDKMSVRTDDSFNDGEWHHCVMTYDGGLAGAGVTIYIDSESRATTVIDDSLTVSTPPSDDLRIAFSSTLVTRDLRMSEVAIYDKELSPSEILDVYNEGTPDDLTTLGSAGNLLGYWQLGEGDSYPTATDRSSAGNDGTMTNMSAGNIVVDAPRAAESHYSILFDSNGYGSFGHRSEYAFEPGSTFSISFWAKTVSAVPVSGYYISQLLDAADFLGWGVLNSIGSQLRFRFWGSGSELLDLNTSGATMDDGEWHHIVLTYNGTGTVAGTRIYQDTSLLINNLIEQNLSSVINDTTGPFNIGNRSNGVNGCRAHMAEVSIWNRVLTEGEIDQLYNGGRPRDARTLGITTNLIGYWRLGEEDISTFTDLSQSGVNGTAVNLTSANIKLESPGIDFNKPSATSQSLALGSGHLEGDTSLNFERTQPISVSTWVYFTSSGATEVVAGNLDPATTFRGWEVLRTSSGFMAFQILNTNTTNHLLVLSDKVYTNEWHHVVWTYDGSSQASGVTLFVDGVRAGTTVSRDSLAATSVSAEVFRIGARVDGTLPMTGYIGEVAIFDREVSEVEVRSMYGSRSVVNVLEYVPVANCIGYWRMHDDTYPTVPDLSSNGRDLTVGGSISEASFQANLPEPYENLYCVSFDASQDEYINYGNVSDLNFNYNQPFTVMAWMKSSAAAGSVLFGKIENSSNFRGWEVNTSGTDNSLRFHLISNVSTNLLDLHGGPAVLYDDTWHSVCFTYDGSALAAGVKLYVDGVYYPSPTVEFDTLTTTTTNAVAFTVGRRQSNTSTDYTGLLDDVAIYDRVLSPSQVFLLHGQSVTQDHSAVGPVDALIGWWRMGDPFGPSSYPTIEDSAVRTDNDGTMTTMDSSNVAAGTAAPIEETLLWYSYSLEDTIHQSVAGFHELAYGSATELTSVVYRMRALADPGPGYVSWDSGTTPDFAGDGAGSAIQAGSVVVASKIGLEDYKIVRVPGLDTVQHVSSSGATIVDPEDGVALVLVNTAAGSWAHQDSVTLPPNPRIGAEVIVKDSGGSADTKSVVVLAAHTIDGNPNVELDVAKGSVHLFFDGTEWGII